MSLLTVVRDVCAVVGVAAPTNVFASINTNRTMFEMLNCANVMAQRTAYDSGRDWSVLMQPASFFGDGSDVEFPFPADYKRMTLTANVRQSNTPLTPLRFISDYDEWMARRANNESDGSGEWIKVGNNMIIWPAPVAGSTITFPYISRNCIALADGGFGDRFIKDEDTFRLDERLLQLGMIWQWKAWKGSPYAEDMGAWSDTIAMEMGHDKPSPIIIGRYPMQGRVAYYGRVPYP